MGEEFSDTNLKQYILENNREKITEYILEHDGDANRFLNCTIFDDDKELTLLAYAGIYGRHEMVGTLLGLGANPGTKNNIDKTAKQHIERAISDGFQELPVEVNLRRDVLEYLNMRETSASTGGGLGKKFKNKRDSKKRRSKKRGSKKRSGKKRSRKKKVK